MLFISALNDCIHKYLMIDSHAICILFFRNFFSFFFIIAYAVINGETLNTSKENIFYHILRGAFLFIGMAIWIECSAYISLVNLTLVTYMMPVFLLIFSFIFLKDEFIWERWVAVFISFIGIIILVFSDIKMEGWYHLLLIFAVMLFALIDIINKKIIDSESMINMLFYSSFVVAILCLPAMISFGFGMMSFSGILISAFLGFNANLLLFCLLRALSFLEISALTPYRYFEFFFAGVLGFIFFNELPDRNFFLSFLFIVPTTLFLTYSEHIKDQKLLDNSEKLK